METETTWDEGVSWSRVDGTREREGERNGGRAGSLASGAGHLPPHRHVDDDQHEQGEGRHATAHDERHRWHGHLIHGLGNGGHKK